LLPMADLRRSSAQKHRPATLQLGTCDVTPKDLQRHTPLGRFHDKRIRIPAFPGAGIDRNNPFPRVISFS